MFESGWSVNLCVNKCVWRFVLRYLCLIQTARVSRTNSYEGAVGRWPGSRICWKRGKYLRLREEQRKWWECQKCSCKSLISQTVLSVSSNVSTFLVDLVFKSQVNITLFNSDLEYSLSLFDAVIGSVSMFVTIRLCK